MALELEYKMGFATPNGGKEMERYLKALTALCSLMVKAGLSLLEREKVMTSITSLKFVHTMKGMCLGPSPSCMSI